MAKKHPSAFPRANGFNRLWKRDFLPANKGLGQGPSPGCARPERMGQKSGKGETGFRTKGGRLEPGLQAPGNCWHSPRGKLVFSPSVKPRKRTSMSLESCAGMKSLQPSSKGSHSQGTGGGGGCQLPGSPRAGQSCCEGPGTAQEQGQVWTLHWLFMHPVTSGNKDSKFHVQTVALQVLFQVWLAGSSARLGTDHHSLLPLFLHPCGGSSALTCTGWSR